ncbi:MAG: LacI family transcriptional regulator [Chloroflexi bacterium]|nr:LacI family transcriptional regulator [Chloroflexota bacterium]
MAQSLRVLPTSMDVARLAGVSRGIVSVVLDGAHSNIRVSEETRQRVLAAAERLHYSPNPFAQSLRRRRSNTLCFVLRQPRSQQQAWPPELDFELSRVAAYAATSHGFHLVEANTESGALGDGRSLLQFLLDRRVDGLLFDCPLNHEVLEQAIAEGIPVVQIRRPLRRVATATVIVDPSEGLSAAVDHLVLLGHRRIAYVGTSDPHPVDQARLHCFRHKLAEHHLPRHAALIHLDFGYTLAHAYRATRDLLALTSRPTAIVAAGDILALGVLRALYEAGVRVPDQMSLVSYDDLFASSLYPPISSVAQPFDRVVTQAIDLLVAFIESPLQPGTPLPHTVLPTQFIVRASTALAPCPPG